MAVAEEIIKNGGELVYINALDYVDLLDKNKYHKTWDDVLDVIVKSRFGAEIPVLSIGNLRRDFHGRTQGRGK